MTSSAHAHCSEAARLPACSAKCAAGTTDMSETGENAVNCPAALGQPPLQVNASYALKLPPFWAKDAEMRFQQAEAHLRRTNIKSDEAKFDHVVSVLQAEVVAEVRNVLLNPPATEKYATLKEAIISA